MSGSCTISYRSSWRFRWDLGGASQRGHDSEGSTVKRLLHVEKRWEFSPGHSLHKGPPHLRNKRTHWAPDSLQHWTTANLSWRKECLSFYSIQCCVGMCPHGIQSCQMALQNQLSSPIFPWVPGTRFRLCSKCFTQRVILPVLKETFLKILFPLPSCNFLLPWISSEMKDPHTMVIHTVNARYL